MRETGVSPALAAIVNRLLQKKPENRFQSASELASALREARERPSVAGYRIADDAPTSAIGATRLPPRRSPMPDRPYRAADETESAARAAFAVAGRRPDRRADRRDGTRILIFGRPLPTFGARRRGRPTIPT